jgi:hypothetical protein
MGGRSGQAVARASAAALSDYPDADIRFNVNDFTDAQAAAYIAMTGVPEDIDGKITLVNFSNSGIVKVKIEGDGLTMERKFNTAEKSVDNFYFEIEKGSRYARASLSIFSKQVQRMAASGFRRITVKAEGSMGDQYNGYYTWARYGYTPVNNTTHEALRGINSQLSAKGLSTYNSITEMMGTSSGRRLWMQYGSTWSGVFDLKPGSDSRKRLSAYYKERTGNVLKP